MQHALLQQRKLHILALYLLSTLIIALPQFDERTLVFHFAHFEMLVFFEGSFCCV